jgi:hypothetical protein
MLYTSNKLLFQNNICFSTKLYELSKMDLLAYMKYGLGFENTSLTMGKIIFDKIIIASYSQS